ncbi:subtilisin-like protein [Epithele typhae]|uniref:subtilisin-like protein n=1 Tax=Epithele typhae TaxID=378194 RepID=UPI002007FD3E|nr:subtilisin-like protein [Epithele typhae]KAH9923397.1 subtilisin-like protein [Epithele typhae]
MLSRSFCNLLGVTALALAAQFVGATTISPRVVHERRAATPRGWSLHRRADPDMVVPLSFALAQPNIELLEAYLLDVADPDSPNYGKHWSPAKVAATFRPTDESVDTVRAWLTSAEGVDASRVRLSKDGGYLDTTVSVAEAEALLGAEYYVYEHTDGTRHVACGDRYHLPSHVAKHVDTVWPTIHFDVVPLSKRTADNTAGRAPAKGSPSDFKPAAAERLASSYPTPPASCYYAMTLDCLRTLYNFNYDLVVPTQHSIGIVEFGMETLNLADLRMFFENYAPDLANKTPTFVSIDGGISNQSITDSDLLLEPNLDLQYAMGLLGEEAQVLQYQVTNEGGPSFSYLPYDLLLKALDADYCTFEGANSSQPEQFDNDEDCGTKPRADVISISYDQAEFVFGSIAAQRQCTEYGKLALTGITFLMSSGDNGVATFSNVCVDAIGYPDVGEPDFAPHIGNTCPYVTSVGATELKAGDPAHREIAPQSFKSGGGFSNFIARPSFQDTAVQSYIANFTGNISAEAFNRAGRAYPDVSALGLNYQVAINQGFWRVYGTSASTPVWAALISAVNDARLAAGKSVVGWANPALYSSAFADVFHDIISGDNFACGPNQDLGFVAAPGWDPVTGLGTPDFEKLLAAWMALP